MEQDGPHPRWDDDPRGGPARDPWADPFADADDPAGAERRARFEERERRRAAREARGLPRTKQPRRRRAVRERSPAVEPVELPALDRAPAPLPDDDIGDALPTRDPTTGGVARNTIIFSIATFLSRIAGLAREVVARGYFGTTGAASAFTLAFQIPNLVRGLFADAALSAAFVPVFTELLEKGKREEAFRLASTLLFVIIAALGAITAAFIVGAGVVMPLFTGDEFDQALTDLTIGLSQVMFPIVVLLGVNGLLVGILNSRGHFSIPAISPLVWNLVIIACLVLLHGQFEGDDQLYAYAIGVLVGTVVQLAMTIPVLKRVGFRLELPIDLRDPRLKQVLVLMLPVTIGLGVINFDLVINSSLGTLVSDEAPSAIDAAFRIYMLPQGMFSVAIATVLFPTLSRLVAREDFDGLRATLAMGMRGILLFLIPAAAFTLVLAVPIVRLVYERGEFDAESTELTATALFWFCFSLPTSGLNLLLTRTFFSLKRPWLPTQIAVGSLMVNAAISLLLYRPFGVAGLVIGTAASSLVMAAGQLVVLRRQLHGRLDLARTAATTVRIVLASVAMAAAAWPVWTLLDGLLGRSLPAQVIAVSAAATVALVVYAGAILVLRVREAEQVRDAVTARLAARRARG